MPDLSFRAVIKSKIVKNLRRFARAKKRQTLKKAFRDGEKMNKASLWLALERKVDELSVRKRFSGRGDN
ncbi:hypothetical protein, partial [Cronobacter sakazakii]|uniref:hypothetical protein n=2 Tax=Cronobacter sakazakii TaxID=28141 RepID=UPI001F31DA0D